MSKGKHYVVGNSCKPKIYPLNGKKCIVPHKLLKPKKVQMRQVLMPKFFLWFAQMKNLHINK